MHPAEIARSEYLTHYRSAIARQRALHDKFAPEVLFELSDRVHLHRRLYRVDIVATDDGKHSVIEANLDRATSLEVSVLLPRGSQVTIRPFVWNGAVFRARGAGPVEVDSWFMRWADIEDKNGGDGDGLGGVIHSLHVTEQGDDRVDYSVDFGSAPIQAFDDFVELLVSAGVTQIEVSSPHLEEKKGEPDGTDNDRAAPGRV